MAYASRGGGDGGGYYRGRGRGRGGGYGGGGGFRGGRLRDPFVRHTDRGPLVDEEAIFEHLNKEPIKKWTLTELAESINNDTAANRPYEIVDRKIVASYNVDKTEGKKRIVVPGAPKVFNEWTGGDLSENFNEERQHVDDRTFEPVLTAVRIMEPEFKLADYDLVADMGVIKALIFACFRIMNAIRKSRNQIPISPPRTSQDEIKLRIDARVIDKTLFLLRAAYELEPAAGVGLAYRRACSKNPLESMMRGEQYGDGGQSDAAITDGQYRVINAIKMGGVRILFADDVDAAVYPDGEEQMGEEKEYVAPTNVELEVDIGGFKGDPSKLTPIAFASLSVRAFGLHTSKWITQYVAGIPTRFLGRHERGVFDDPPTKNTLDEVREKCHLDKASADLWARTVERVLDEIVFVARNHDFEITDDESGGRFAIVVDPDANPDRGSISIHELRREDGRRFDQVFLVENVAMVIVDDRLMAEGRCEDANRK